MTRWVPAALAVVLLGAAPLSAADEVKKPIGTWTKKNDNITITWTIKADGLSAKVKGENTIEVFADYGLSKDGVLFARIHKVKKEGNDGPEEGDLFSFRFKMEKDKLVLSDLTAAKSNEQIKQIVEGDYVKESKDK
jgi:hypothetical protein